MRNSLPVLNATQATFECIFGRGCDGICCQHGEPSLYPDELERIHDNLAKFLPELRPEARSVVEKDGYLGDGKKLDMPMLRVVEGWCIFFNKGCVLHKVGGAEGDIYRYKPAQCSLFPLGKTEHDEWFIRQHGYKDEPWDLFCLNPAATSKLAVASLQDEMNLAAKYDAETAAAKNGKCE